MRWTVAIDGLAMSRSTCERKLSVTPARSATSRSVSWRAWRNARIRAPSCSSATSRPRLLRLVGVPRPLCAGATG